MIKLFCNYQQIDFVFRPHPLLRENLNKEDCWGAAKTGRYWEELEKMSNVIISSQGDYLQEFADSDAMMHDCGSFAAEYLITGKPCAYFLRSDLDQEHLFTDLGRKCVSSHYPVSSYESMVTFIEKVVLAENDSMKAARDKFAKEKLMYNYPHASEAIVADIKQSLGRA